MDNNKGSFSIFTKGYKGMHAFCVLNNFSKKEVANEQHSASKIDLPPEQSEMEALITGLNKVKSEIKNFSKIYIFTNAEHMYDVLKGNKKPDLTQKLYQKIVYASKDLNTEVFWVPSNYEDKKKNSSSRIKEKIKNIPLLFDPQEYDECFNKLVNVLNAQRRINHKKL